MRGRVLLLIRISARVSAQQRRQADPQQQDHDHAEGRHDDRGGPVQGDVEDQCDHSDGHWTGRVRTDEGDWIDVDGILGWAEDVHNRW